MSCVHVIAWAKIFPPFKREIYPIMQLIISIFSINIDPSELTITPGVWNMCTHEWPHFLYPTSGSYEFIRILYARMNAYMQNTSSHMWINWVIFKACQTFGWEKTFWEFRSQGSRKWTSPFPKRWRFGNLFSPHNSEHLPLLCILDNRVVE